MDRLILGHEVGLDQVLEWQSVMLPTNIMALIVVCVEQLFQFNRLSDNLYLSLFACHVGLYLLYFVLFLLHLFLLPEKLVQNETAFLKLDIKGRALSLFFEISWFLYLYQGMSVVSIGFTLLTKIKVPADGAFVPDSFNV